ncbi:unnamed protein product [Dicrocoelium dendriticum]|nr:unnamed protein product [Dicrocoelium dendriticum]
MLCSRPVSGSPPDERLFCCVKCSQPIIETHLLLADGVYWHEDCLRCACCDVRLAELDKVYYVKAKMPLCRRDYLRLCGRTGECVVCGRRILAFEFVMKIREDFYHLNCFCCQSCQMRFCVGDRFYIHQKTILCEKDYADSSLFSFASLPLYNSADALVPRRRAQVHSDSDGDFPTFISYTPDASNGNTSKLFDNQLDNMVMIPRPSGTMRTHPNTHSNLNASDATLIRPSCPNTVKCPQDSVLCCRSDDQSSGYGSPTPPSVDL